MSNRLIEYLSRECESLNSCYNTGKLSKNNSDKGTDMEKRLRDFFREHLPKSMVADIGGTIIGLPAQESGQIDLIIGGNSSINFLQNKKMFTTVEGTIAAISIKSLLDKKAIEDALENLSKIPQCDESVVDCTGLKLLTKNHKRSFGKEYCINFPTCYVFAFDGIKAETLCTYVNEFYKNSKIPINRRATLIIVNMKYYLIRGDYWSPPTTIYKVQLLDKDPGIPLGMIIAGAINSLSWMSRIDLDYTSYFLKGLI